MRRDQHVLGAARSAVIISAGLKRTSQEGTLAMIGKTFSALGAAALLTGVTIAAQPERRPAPRNNAERIICRSMPDQGSRFVTQRSCHTKAEWAELRRQTKATIDHIQNSRAGSGQ